MENNWLNAMSPDEIDLISLSDGTVAPRDVARDLLRALEIGKEAYNFTNQVT